MDKTVGILGLGAMGSALARAQLQAGFETIVWNRTAEKTRALESSGATVAASGADLVLSCGVILLCVDTCPSAEAALSTALRPGALAGRTIVQLGTTTPTEARDFANKVRIAGGAALDGAIMCYPDSVGPSNEAPLLIGGDLDGLTAARPFLAQISANLIELGDNIAAAAALDLGLLTTSIALYAGTAQAARLCEAEGVNLDLLAKLCAHGPRASERIEIVGRGAFELNSLYDGGSLAVWADVAKTVHQHAIDAKINEELPEFLNTLYSRAVAAGLGGEDVAALVKVLRD